MFWYGVNDVNGVCVADRINDVGGNMFRRVSGGGDA